MLYNFRRRQDKNRKPRVADRYDDEKLIPLIPNWLRDDDISLLLTVARLRLSNIEVLRLASPGLSVRKTYARLLALKKSGHIISWANPSYRPKGAKNHHDVYALSKLGARLLSLETGKPTEDFLTYHENRPPSAPFISHVVEVGRVLVLFECWAQAIGAKVEQWSSESHLHKLMQGRGFNIPDGYLLIRFANGVVGHVFVEMDRGTERAARWWSSKFDGYTRLLDSGRFGLQFDTPDSAFTIITVTPDAKRSAKLVSQCVARAKSHMRPLFYFATLDQLASQNVFTESYCVRGDGVFPIAFI